MSARGYALHGVRPKLFFSNIRANESVDVNRVRTTELQQARVATLGGDKSTHIAVRIVSPYKTPEPGRLARDRLKFR